MRALLRSRSAARFCLGDVTFHFFEIDAKYSADETATLREDRECPTLGTEAALSNAPQKGAGYFKVPRIIER